ncbi:MAG: type II secretion system secretin GspD [Pseudomonadota bacterium]
MRRYRFVFFLVTLSLFAGCAGYSKGPLTNPNIRLKDSLDTSTPDDVSQAPQVTPLQTEYFGGEGSSGPRTARASETIEYDEDGIELNFENADIRRITDGILGDILKYDYWIDPGVQGRTTLRTGRPVTRESLVPALEAALAQVGAAIVVTNGQYQIMPIAAARSRVSNITLRSPGSRRFLPGYATEIIPLRFVKASEVEKILRPLSGSGSIVQTDDIRNHIIIAGTASDRANMVQVIDSFDVDWIEGMTFALYRLQNVEPEKLIAELKSVFAPPMDILENRVRLVPMTRIKAILGISSEMRELRQIEEWITRLDVSAETGSRRLFVYNVQNGRAADLASALQLVTTGNADTLGATVGGPVTSTGNQNEGQLRIVPDEENNSLLIFATGEEYRVIQDALKSLDVLSRQVMLEAVLAEVTLNDNLEYGLQWSFDDDEGTIVFSGSDNGAVSSSFPGFSLVYSGTANARVVLNAIQSVSDVKILSSPKIMVLNNQTALIQVGDQVPIVTQQSQGTVTGDAPLINTVELRDTGVILEVTPRINDSGVVIIDVSQEVSDVAQTITSGIDSPTIQQRLLETTVAVSDGNTIALGGLIRESQTVGNSGVPILKDIPLLGNLFRTNNRTAIRTELMVLLTPYVMRNSTETRGIMQDFIEQFEILSPLVTKEQ